MKVDAALVTQGMDGAGAAARALEDRGYDGVFTFEGQHDPFFPLLLAARETKRLQLMTAIAVAFARSPMILANVGHDLQAASGGRFVLGLGSQIRPHIERRFSSPWSKPAARMREFVLALRAIWRTWNERVRLDFRGEFYTHTLMTPFFDPGPSETGAPLVFVAGVGPRMTQVAGEVADGFFLHPFHTAEFVRDTTLPALARGQASAEHETASFEVAAQVMIATGESDEARERAEQAVRAQIAFYASTPAYRGVLASADRADLQPELNALSKRGEWSEMASRIDDELLNRIAIRSALGDLPDLLRERYGSFATRLSLVAPYASDIGIFDDTLSALRSR